ncbi:MAG: iron-containing alcohol dehydrogenase [Rhodobacteraceae bacterium]|nr:MAG: iron-containing alcohol dehydrogenase [Paracoccaceae bacterium]
MQSQSAQSWSAHNPVAVHFGPGCRTALRPRLSGQKLLVVTTARGRAQFTADPVLGTIQADLSWVDTVQPNPGLTDTQAEIDRLAGQSFDAVLAFGGGSAMDAAKALAAALAPSLTPGLPCRDLATLIADPGTHLDRPLLPLHAITTTSGTGAEVTPFATIWDHENRRKLSLASPRLFPQTAIVDPELTYGLPHAATVSTSLDALNQAFESVWNRNRTPLTTLMAARAIALGLDAIPRLAADPGDHTARAMIAETSLLAGLCISQTRTAICHSISYPLTAHFGLAHGMACAFTMGAVADLVLERAPEALSEVAALSGHGTATALVAALHRVLAALDISARCRAALPGTEALMALRPDMHTPGRADNFSLEMNDDTLALVLTRS